MMTRWLVLCILFVGLAGCGQVLTGVTVFYSSPHAPLPPGPGPHVTMHYLGNGGWVIRYEKAVVVTAPFFSNPRGLSVYLPGGSDVERVRQELKNVDLSDVKIMLIGHGHYDHAMDLLAILNEHATDATLYASTTVGHLLRTRINPRKNGGQTIVDVTPAPGKPTTWRDATPSPSSEAFVRVTPLRSAHAPHLLGFVKVVSSGMLVEDAAALPLTPAGWPEGETLAFLIDFVKDTDVVFRIYYQDSAAPPGVGAPTIGTGRPVDVAILCVAGFSQVKDSPDSILSAMGTNGPRYVVGGHWEDFFSAFVGPLPRVAFGTSLDEFVRRATKKAPVFIPAPKETLTFPLSR